MAHGMRCRGRVSHCVRMRCMTSPFNSLTQIRPLPLDCIQDQPGLSSTVGCSTSHCTAARTMLLAMKCSPALPASHCRDASIGTSQRCAFTHGLVTRTMLQDCAMTHTHMDKRTHISTDIYLPRLACNIMPMPSAPAVPCPIQRCMHLRRQRCSSQLQRPLPVPSTPPASPQHSPSAPPTVTPARLPCATR